MIMTFEEATAPQRIPEIGETVLQPDSGKMIAIVQFRDGPDVTTPVKNEAEAKRIVMKAFKTHGDKVLGGYCATRTNTD